MSDTGELERQVEEEVAAWSAVLSAASGEFFTVTGATTSNEIAATSRIFCDGGQRYDYMIVLDADSIMSGKILTASGAVDGALHT